MWEFNRPMPIAKALDPDTILAYKMNGVDLPARPWRSSSGGGPGVGGEQQREMVDPNRSLHRDPVGP